MNAPINFPEVTLAGVTYTFKYSLGSVRFAQEHGIEGVVPDKADFAGQLKYIREQAAVCAHIKDPKGYLLHAGILPEQMEALIDGADLAAISRALNEASGKVLRDASPQSEPAEAPPTVQ